MADDSFKARRIRLAQLLGTGTVVMAPSCSDALSARLVALAGLPAVHCASSVFHQASGYADAGILTMTEFVSAIASIADAVDLPVIADADTGFGSAANVIRTVKAYERAGASALHIEDQVTPTRPAMQPGFTVNTISRTEMIGKIKAAVDARTDEHFLVIARSDAGGGRQERVDRLAACLEAGADAAWLPPGTDDEIRDTRRQIDKPLVGVLAGGRTAQQFESMGVNCALLPGALQIAALQAQWQMLQALKTQGRPDDLFKGLPGIDEMRTFYSRQGAAWLQEVERKYG